MLLSASSGLFDSAADQVVDLGPFNPMIVAGDPNGSPTDSPANRVDSNTTTSPFAGVGSVQISANRGTYICTGTPFDIPSTLVVERTYVLTAAHCVDLNNDGKSDKKDGIKSVKFNLNLDIDAGTDKVDVSITAASWVTHPNFTGFNKPSVNDDLAVLTLGAELPPGVPIYDLATSDMAAGTTLYLVGYGRSGDGVNGYTTNASWTIKRRGENNADAFYTQDDAGALDPEAKEVFRFDFDGPTGNGTWGGSTLGNDKETTLGGGDSGGPSFVLESGSYRLAGVNTFTQGLTAPKFGSLGGGINVFPYTSWINTVTTGTSSSTSGGSGGHGGGPPPGDALGFDSWIPGPPVGDVPGLAAEAFVIGPPDLSSEVVLAAGQAENSPDVHSVGATDVSGWSLATAVDGDGESPYEAAVVWISLGTYFGAAESEASPNVAQDEPLNALDEVFDAGLLMLDR
jgi:hypothetical protein